MRFRNILGADSHSHHSFELRELSTPLDHSIGWPLKDLQSRSTHIDRCRQSGFMSMQRMLLVHGGAELGNIQLTRHSERILCTRRPLPQAELSQRDTLAWFQLSCI